MEGSSSLERKKKSGLRRQWQEAKEYVADLGTWENIKSGEWFVKLVQKSLTNRFYHYQPVSEWI